MRAPHAQTAIILLFGFVLAAGGGTIDTTGATIEAGVAPTAGVVTIDPAGPATVPPAFPTREPQGTITGSLPPMPDTGTAALGDVTISADATLSGGTYDYASLTVDDGATLTFTGAVTIRATNLVDLEGSIETTGDDASITIVVANSFRVRHMSGAPVTGIRTTGARSPITIDAGGVRIGTFEVGGPFAEGILAEVTTVDGAVTLRSYGLMEDRAFGAFIQSSVVSPGSGDLTIQAADYVDFSSSEFATTGGDVVIQAFGHSVRWFGGLDATAFDGDLLVEAAGGIYVDQVDVATTGGDIRIEAFGGDARLYTSGFLANGALTVAASGSVRTKWDADLGSEGTGVLIVAHGGAVELRGENRITCTKGDIEVIGPMGITAERTTDTALICSGESVSFVTRGGGVALEAEKVEATAGALLVQAQESVELIGTYEAEAGIEVFSVAGSIDVPGATLSTEPDVGDASGGILIESFGGATGIEAAGATVRSGDNAVASGDVTLRVQDRLVDSFVLPKAVKLKLNEANPERSSLEVVGFFDTGGGTAALAGPATLEVGELTIAAELAARGRGFAFADDAVKFQIKPGKSSRAKFKLQVKGDIEGLIEPNEPLVMRFATASADGMGRVGLEAGCYKLGKKRGTLAEPPVFPLKVKAGHRGAGKDTLSLKAGLATDGVTPDEAPDVTVRYGGVLEITIPGGELARTGDKFVANAPASAPEVTSLALDFARETLTLRAKGLDLGALPGGPIAVQIKVSLGGDARAVRVRMVPAGRSLRY
jgi:hypothetical protein